MLNPKDIQAYLCNKPLFYCFIRPQELAYFAKYMHSISHAKILDLGCGDGFFLKTLLQNNPDKFNGISWDGVDINESEIKLAKQKQIYDTASIVTNTFPFSDGTFDDVISNCVLEHVTDLSQNLQETYRVLKPSGKYYVSVMTKNWDHYLSEHLLFGHQYTQYMRTIQKHPNLLSNSEWHTLFESRDFKVIANHGYVDIKNARLLELFHYLSIPSLISYKLTKQWVWWGRLLQTIGLPEWIGNKLSIDIPPHEAMANYFILQK